MGDAPPNWGAPWPSALNRTSGEGATNASSRNPLRPDQIEDLGTVPVQVCVGSVDACGVCNGNGTSCVPLDPQDDDAIPSARTQVLWASLFVVLGCMLIASILVTLKKAGFLKCCERRRRRRRPGGRVDPATGATRLTEKEFNRIKTYVSTRGRDSGTVEKQDTLSFDDTDCAICLCPMEGEEPCVMPACGHVFHRACLHGWAERSTKCPTCRHDLRDLAGPGRPASSSTDSTDSTDSSTSAVVVDVAEEEVKAEQATPLSA